MNNNDRAKRDKLFEDLTGMTPEEIQKCDPPRVASADDVFFPSSISALSHLPVRIREKMVTGPSDLIREKWGLKKSLYECFRD